MERLRDRLSLVAEGEREEEVARPSAIATLDDSVRLMLLDVLAAAAADIMRELAPGSVELRLRGSEPEFVVTMPARPRQRRRLGARRGSSGPADEAPGGDMAPGGGRARRGSTCGCPSSSRHGSSRPPSMRACPINAWLVRAVGAVVERGALPRRRNSDTGRSVQRYTGGGGRCRRLRHPPANRAPARARRRRGPDRRRRARRDGRRGPPQRRVKARRCGRCRADAGRGRSWSDSWSRRRGAGAYTPVRQRRLGGRARRASRRIAGGHQVRHGRRTLQRPAGRESDQDRTRRHRRRARGQRQADHGDGRHRRRAGQRAAELSTGSGDIRAGELSGTTKIKNANGDVHVAEAIRGSVSARTGFGQIEVGIPDGTAAWLDLSTGYGEVRNGLDRSGPPEPGEESVEVRAHSGYGDITIARAHPDAS